MPLFFDNTILRKIVLINDYDPVSYYICSIFIIIY